MGERNGRLDSEVVGHGGIDGSAVRAQPSPLWVVLALTWVTSVGSAAGWNGIYFVASRVYGFTDDQNLMLGVAMGASYTLAAWLASRVKRWSERRGQALSSRGFLGLILTLSGLVSLIPLFVRHEGAIWVFGVLYIALCGFIWPSVEMFVSGGRRAGALRIASGSFNISWASAVMIAMWLIAPLMKDHAIWVLGGLAPLHIASLALVGLLPKEPGQHDSGAHPHTEAERDRFAMLLRVFRVCLVMSYLAHAALTPMIPQFMERLGVDVSLKTVYYSSWMISRLLMFGLLMWWQGWHGRIRTAIWSMSLLGGGFVLALVSTSPLMLVIGLVVLGAGIGAVYAAAIYYALEVGSTDIDAGGKHESMIGLGYTVGPLAGLGLVRLPGVAGT